MARLWVRRLVWRIHPARAVVMAFGAVVVIGATLLALPVSSADGTVTDLITTLFTATSAVCVTGLVTVDTGTHWSGFGQGVILGLIQVGGFGIMALASLLALLIAGKLRLRLQMSARVETKSTGIGEVRAVLVRIAAITLVIETIIALTLTFRFALGYGEAWGDALYHGVFHSISAFNNAGFSINADSLTRYAGDAWITLPIAVAVILGGLGFPVIIELLRHRVRRRTSGRTGWSLHLKLTVVTTAALLLAGSLLTLALEWSNGGTLGPMHTGEKVLNAFFHSAMTRTAGFNAVDVGAMEQATLLGTCALMFIGGGSAGTAGGIKVTTFAVLGAAILAEVRGEPSSGIFGRRLAPHVLRQALTVVLLGLGLIVAATIALLTLVEERFEVVLFETVSAFGTVGLSAGVTGDLPPVGEVIIVVLMFVGRLGPITLVSALALRERTRRYQYPEERPIIG
ncbi:potassium transporter TrkG [Streptomyces calidiresistens]|uniref:TrkH family potassium uptake protein n=1 Tax=Streptomyces calidiresistens TaxID=1485586 RepID=A0A7W3XWW9_9ACTN|nr:potassium transporter TrkG [Streptomyces calidiresistens]MBB0230510.1 TrkH family potassium uptake protein [Streptomyces calidiresistens]